MKDRGHFVKVPLVDIGAVEEVDSLSCKANTTYNTVLFQLQLPLAAHASSFSSGLPPILLLCRS